jgi:hypothetical protein
MLCRCRDCGKWRREHMALIEWCFSEYPVTSSGVKILGPTLVCYSWQCGVLCVVTLSEVLLELDFQGEN